MNKYESKAERLIEPFHDFNSRPEYQRLTLLKCVSGAIILQLSVSADIAAMDLHLQPDSSSPIRRAQRHLIFDDGSRIGEFITFDSTNARCSNRLFLTKTPVDDFYRSYEVGYQHRGGRNVHKTHRTVTVDDAREEYLREVGMIANGIRPDLAKTASQSQTILSTAEASPSITHVGDIEIHDASVLLRGNPFQPYH
jgi:hypothetical protein